MTEGIAIVLSSWGFTILTLLCAYGWCQLTKPKEEPKSNQVQSWSLSKEDVAKILDTIERSKANLGIERGPDGKFAKIKKESL